MDRRQSLFAGASLIAVLAGLRLAGASADNETIEAAKFEVAKTDAEWRSQLTAAEYAILRGHGTERPGSSPLNGEKRRGRFACAGCDLPLFSSDAKYESGTGWPSFWAPLPGAVASRADSTLGMRRVEAHCRRCGGHLGHVFEDGPAPTGQRYCMNGAALRFSAA